MAARRTPARVNATWVVIIAAMAMTVFSAQTPAPSPPARHVVEADDHPLTVWARVPPAPREAVLLIHGRTWSSLPDFDLQVPGLRRSVMSSLAARGIAAYAVDLRGYGATPRDASGWLTPARAAADIAHVLAWIAGRHATIGRPAVVGWSRGAAIGQLAVQRAPRLASSLVLFGFAFEPGSRFADLALARVPVRARNTEAAARSDFISPRVTAPAVIRAFVEHALRADPVLVDLRGEDEFNALDPARVEVPVLLIHGDRDPMVTSELVAKMGGAFPRAPRTVVLAGADHAAHLESTHEQWVEAVDAFVSGN